jgi:hypothetical protein
VQGLLQHANLILSPERHARHHCPPHPDAYCVAGGWRNPLFEAVDFWRALGRAVACAMDAALRGDAVRPL